MEVSNSFLGPDPDRVCLRFSGRRRSAEKRAGGGAILNDVRLVTPGRISYEEGLRLQAEAALRCRESGEETLFLLEHDACYTIGRNADRSEILFSPERCRELKISIHESDRGGRVTYHGPGQLVGYPILNLASSRRDVKGYVTDLEESILITLRHFGIEASRSNRKERVTSVWIGNDKIAAIGVHLSRWITTHGFALNVSTDLSHFRGIIPCGISDGGVISMERALGRGVTVESVLTAYLPAFESVFGRRIARPTD